MKVIKIDNTKITECEYPNCDISQPVIGLNLIKIDGKLVKDESNHIEYFYIIDILPENPEPLTKKLVKQAPRLTDEIHPEYKHLCLAYYDYVLIDIPKDEIQENDVIKQLNEDLGNYLDSEYLIATRIKHVYELSYDPFVIGGQRRTYILSLIDWLNKCREIRDERELNYLSSGIIPQMGGYPPKPIETF